MASKKSLAMRDIDKIVARIARDRVRQEYKTLADKAREAAGLVRADVNPMDAGHELAHMRDLPESNGRDPTKVRPSIGRWFRGALEIPPSPESPLAAAAFANITRYAKIVALKKTNGGTWTLAVEGVLWPWYATANPCDSAGGNVDTATTIYLRFPAALSVDITTKGGPGVCANAANDVVGYTPSDGQTAAADANVMTGEILWHSLRMRQDLPILSSTALSARMLWTEADAPDVHFNYTTGWQIDAAFAGLFPVGYKAEDDDFGVLLTQGGTKAHTHSVSGDTSGPSGGAYTVDDGAAVEVATANHVHSFNLGPLSPSVLHLPPFYVVHYLKWVGF